MKITAHYECRRGAQSYSVSLEKTGDSSKQNIPELINEMFDRAKLAIDSRIKSEPENEVSPANGNSDLPATSKQKALIIRMAKERGQFVDNLNSLTMGQANQVINELKILPVGEVANV